MRLLCRLARFLEDRSWMVHLSRAIKRELPGYLPPPSYRAALNLGPVVTLLQRGNFPQISRGTGWDRECALLPCR